jgi:eukaryotic-like serine/threonine-protein kinase
MALATGWAEVKGRLPAGDAIDRAARMLAERANGAGQGAAIAIDEVTAGLLDARFEVVETEAGLLLASEQALAAGARTLLGKPTACVGRDREITMLTGLFTECAEEPRAHAVLVTAPAGMGKTRLVYEFLRRVRQRDEPVEVWIGRGDPMRKGSAFGLLGQALAGAFGLKDGEPLVVRREMIRAQIAEDFSGADAQRIAEFLGEIVGTPFLEEDSMPLRAARTDAPLMGDQMRRAWVDFLDARCAAAPVLVVLEDLHWGDLPTVRFIDDALRRLKDMPWMVLGLARPEVHDIFPKLWAERNVQELRLGELSLKAGARLVRQVLGEGTSTQTVERLVAQADGNTFYLEELIRAAAEGSRKTLPETVLAMLEGRLEALDAEDRRLLRAASVFGQTFWQGAVEALLGGEALVPWLSEHVARLEQLEWISARPEAKFQGERELCFRHALVREAAYGMLTDEDRALGHRLAGAWLEQKGEGDPLVLVEHFERGKEPARAAGHYVRAAEQALRGDDAIAAIALARKALDRGVSESVRTELLGTLCEANAWLNRAGDGDATVDEILRLAAPGSVPWAQAVVGKLLCALAVGAWDTVVTTLHLALTASPADDAVSTMAFALAAGAILAHWHGLRDLADSSRERLCAIVAPVAGHDPIARGWMELSLAYNEPCSNEAPWAGLAWSEAARASFQEAGHVQGAVLVRMFAGLNFWLLGAHPRAEHELRGSPEETVNKTVNNLSSTRRLYLAGVMADSGALDKALAEAIPMAEHWHAQGACYHEGRWRWMCGDVLRRLNRLSEAEREALAALDLLGRSAPERAVMMATLAATVLAQGRPAEALASAEGAMAELEELGGFAFKGAFVHLVHAEALHAAGKDADAAEKIAAARERLLAQAGKIADSALEQSFLENVPENARTLELARQWLGEPGAAAL